MHLNRNSRLLQALQNNSPRNDFKAGFTKALGYTRAAPHVSRGIIFSFNSHYNK